MWLFANLGEGTKSIPKWAKEGVFGRILKIMSDRKRKSYVGVSREFESLEDNSSSLGFNYGQPIALTYELFLKETSSHDVALQKTIDDFKSSVDEKTIISVINKLSNKRESS